MSFKEYQEQRKNSKPQGRGFSSDRKRGGGSGRFSRDKKPFDRDRKPAGEKRFGGDRKFNNDRKGKSAFGNNRREFSKSPVKENLREQFTSIKFPNTYMDIKRRNVDLFTENLTPGITFFGERVFTKNIDGKLVEMRNWDYRRSKLGSAIALKVSQLGISEGSKVLYLGASHGFTPSYVSDMVGKTGFVFCLDFAPRVVRDLYLLCQKRENMVPIIADANKPEDYEDLVPEVDVIFMDIAQREQVDIFLKNFRFLKKGGFALLALKARSVDVTKKPKHIFKMAREKLEKHTEIVDYRELDPYEKDHCFFVCKKE
jgi:fibrillarin-like pre-rRNA processing protein